jgi:hypothetical protein
MRARGISRHRPSFPLRPLGGLLPSSLLSLPDAIQIKFQPMDVLIWSSMCSRNEQAPLDGRRMLHLPPAICPIRPRPRCHRPHRDICRQRACSVARDTGRPSRADRGACRGMARLQFPVIPGREQNERTRNPETGTEFVPDFGSGATCRPGMTAKLHRRLHPGSPNAADSGSEAARTRRALLPRLCRAVAAGVGHCSKRRAAMIGIELAASRRASDRHHEFPSNLHLATIFGQIAYLLE